MYVGGRSRRPRMTFGRSRCNVKGRMWPFSELNHAWCFHSSQWQHVARLKTWFRWKIGRRLSHLWLYSSVTWTGLTIFCQRLRKGCSISSVKFQHVPLSAAVRQPFQKKIIGSSTLLHSRGLNPRPGAIPATFTMVGRVVGESKWPPSSIQKLRRIERRKNIGLLLMSTYEST